MAKEKYPTTAAIRYLKQHKIDYTPQLYTYEDKGGTRASSQQLGVDEYRVIKTLVMEDELKRPLIILMHGNRAVSTKELARTLQVKQIAPCNAQVATKHTGYQVGGTSPFGIKKNIPIHVERSVLNLESIYINGGKRGFLVTLSPQVLLEPLGAVPVTVAINR